MSLEIYFAYIMATLIVLAIPGPTILLVIGYALSHGRRSATACVLGVGLGDATAATASLLGVGAILAASATAFSILKIIGALYLAYLGIKMWRAKVMPVVQEEAPSIPTGRIFAHAYVVTALNPKAIMFFIAFLPQFISPEEPAAPQLMLLGATFVVLGIGNAAVYALAASAARERLREGRFLKLANRVGGGLLISAAAATLTLQRN